MRLSQIYCPECGSPLEDVRIKNPHNEHDEFCSEECARLNRVEFCKAAPQIYVLSDSDNETRGVYSKDNLRLGVQYWMELHPEKTLSYMLWSLGYPAEPEEWEWCYIAPGSSEKVLASGGGAIPKREYWGKNLVGITWESFEVEE